MRDNLVACLQSRIFPHISGLLANDYNIALAQADWIEKFRYNETLINIIIDRAIWLKDKAPMYYTNVAYTIYHKVVTELYKNKHLINVDPSMLSTIDSIFPDIIDPKILKYSKSPDLFCYKISLLTHLTAGYILGFPVQNMIPTDDQISHSLDYIGCHGLDLYIQHIQTNIIKTYIPTMPIECGTGTYSNETDVILEDINDYSPFDIVAYQVGSHIYRFTRPEFPQILKSKKNPWTNEWLPPTILYLIRSRLDASEELEFPSSRPLKELMSHLQTGTLFQQEPKTQSENKKIR